MLRRRYGSIRIPLAGGQLVGTLLKAILKQQPTRQHIAAQAGSKDITGGHRESAADSFHRFFGRSES